MRFSCHLALFPSVPLAKRTDAAGKGQASKLRAVGRQQAFFEQLGGSGHQGVEGEVRCREENRR